MLFFVNPLKFLVNSNGNDLLKEKLVSLIGLKINCSIISENADGSSSGYNVKYFSEGCATEQVYSIPTDLDKAYMSLNSYEPLRGIENIYLKDVTSINYRWSNGTFSETLSSDNQNFISGYKRLILTGDQSVIPYLFTAGDYTVIEFY